MAHGIHYRWEGVIKSGEQVRGVMVANNMELAKAELRKQGIVTRKMVIKRQSLFNRCNRKIKAIDITLFTRQMATLIKAGIPLMRSFEILEAGLDKQRMKSLVGSIKKDVATGLMFAQALSKHPLYFNALFCSMVHAGEQSGQLELMLDKVATHQEKVANIKNKIKQALTYPLAVILIAIAVTCGLLMCVIPQFESLYTSFGATLPTMTRYVINLSAFFNTWWSVIFSIIAALFYGGMYAHQKITAFATMNHRLVLKIPIIGDILQKASISRFSRTLSITYAAGLPLTDALKSVANATGNSQYAQATLSIREDISNGQTMQHAIQKTKLFPSLVTQLISIGEESGMLEEMLGKIADFYEEDVDHAVDTFSSLLEPVIMTILGLLIGGLVVAMYLPILKLGSVVS